MRSTVLAVMAVVGVMLAADARAAVVAEYRADFTPTGAPRTGWSYQWNATGPVEVTDGTNFFLNGAALATLLRDTSGNFETQANTTYPDAAPANGLAATPTSLIPGQSSTEGTEADPNSRWAIATYTIQATDVATYGSQGMMDTYSFIVPAGGDGVTARIYLNGFRIVQSPLPSPIVYDQNFPGAYPIPLGELKAGDTISVAVGAGATSLNDRLDLNYTISLVPEPGSAAVAGLAAASLLARRRNRGR